MKAILAAYYWLGGNVSVVPALQLDYDVGIVVGFISFEEVVLPVDEWEHFCTLKEPIIAYLMGQTDALECQLPNFMMLVDHSTRELVLKSKQTWNTVRLTIDHFKNLISIAPMVSKYIKKLEKKLPLAQHENLKMSKDVMLDGLTAARSEVREKALETLSKYKTEGHRIVRELAIIYEEEMIKLALGGISNC